jgi:uncharacterized protein
MLLFEWHPEKAKKNHRIHGITFDEASTVFSDPLSLIIYDPLHSEAEDRFIIIGKSFKNRLLVIVHVDREDRIRIISARKATQKERRHYEKNAH